MSCSDPVGRQAGVVDGQDDYVDDEGDSVHDYLHLTILTISLKHL